MITYYTPFHHHPPTNQPLLHVHNCLVEVSQPPQEIIDTKPQPRSPFTFGFPRQTLDAKSSRERERERNGSILCAGRKIERKIRNRARDNFVCTYIMKIVNYTYRHTRSRSE